MPWHSHTHTRAHTTQRHARTDVHYVRHPHRSRLPVSSPPPPASPPAASLSPVPAMHAPMDRRPTEHVRAQTRSCTRASRPGDYGSLWFLTWYHARAHTHTLLTHTALLHTLTHTFYTHKHTPSTRTHLLHARTPLLHARTATQQLAPRGARGVVGLCTPCCCRQWVMPRFVPVVVAVVMMVMVVSARQAKPAAGNKTPIHHVVLA